MNKRFSAFCLPLVLLGSVAVSQAQGGFTYLDDEAEETGYDVTAAITKMPMEMILAEQENGDSYRLKVSATGVQLAIQTKGVARPLATVKDRISTGSMVAQRRGPRWRFISGNRVVLQAEDDRWHSGRIGYRGGLKDPRVQPIEDVFFDDDFMRVAADVAIAQSKRDPRLGVKIADVKTDESLWKNLAGNWSTTGLSENEQAQVAQSANPFVYKGGAQGANLSTTGRPFWSDYMAEASVKPEGAAAVGLALYCQDEKNYLLFHWKAAGPMQLRAVVNGQPRVLDQVANGFEQNQWYRLRFSVAGGVLRSYIDDVEVLRARTGLFGRGPVGLYVENNTNKDSAVFDDVQVRSIRDFHDDFGSIVPGRWQTVAGAWNLTRVAQPAGKDGAFAVMGEASWKDYITSAEFSLPTDAAAGLVLHHKPGQGAYLLRMAGAKSKLPYAGKVQIVKTSGGQTKLLGEAKIANRYDGKPTTWTFASERGYLKGLANGARIVDAFDESIRGGRAGIFAQRGQYGVPKLTSFSVEFPRPRSTWAKVPDLYEEEKQAETMGGWSTPEGFWVAAAPVSTIAAPATTSPGNKVLWHKGTFWGDGSVRFKLPALDAAQELKLLFDAVQSSPSRDARSITLSLRATGNTLKANLARNGSAQNGKPNRWNGELKMEGNITGQPVEVVQRGNFIIVRAGNPDKVRTLLVARVV